MSLSELFKGVIAREAERWRYITSETVLENLKKVTGAAGYYYIIIFLKDAEFDRAGWPASEGCLINIMRAFSCS
jgi:hypothetical protein